MLVDREAAALAIPDFLKALGCDPTQHTFLADTPQRVSDTPADELLRGHRVRAKELLQGGSCDGPSYVTSGPAAVTGRDAPSSVKSGPVAVTEIAVATVCPHHLLPALGVAHVIYLPGKSLLGIGTITALVDAFARRLTLQEAIGQNVVNALIEHAGARGAYCELELEHSCLRARGERQVSAVVRSSARAGEFSSASAVSEIALALGRGRGDA